MKRLFTSITGFWALLSAIFLLLVPSQLQASGIIYELDNAYSGASPSGSGPWVDVSFENVSAGTVKLTINNVNLVSGEFISGLYLNINQDPNNLLFNYDSSSGDFTIPSQNAGSIQTGSNSFKAGGGGTYDIFFSFATAHADRFTGGDSVTYMITGISGLTAADFGSLGGPHGGHGPFYAAAHIQAIPTGVHPQTIPQNGDDSGWIEPSGGVTPVPEPSPLTIAALSLCLLVFVRWTLCRTARS